MFNIFQPCFWRSWSQTNSFFWGGGIESCWRQAHEVATNDEVPPHHSGSNLGMIPNWRAVIFRVKPGSSGGCREFPHHWNHTMGVFSIRGMGLFMILELLHVYFAFMGIYDKFSPWNWELAWYTPYLHKAIESTVLDLSPIKSLVDSPHPEAHLVDTQMC